MEDYFTVYVKDDCPWCTRAVGLLNDRKEMFMVVNITQLSDLHRDNVKGFVGWDTFPMVLEHEEGQPPRLLGGCTELFEYLDEELTNAEV